MTTKPENCCADGCGRPTQSHNVAVDVSDYDTIGMPTLAGVVCHRCWSGETDGVPEIGALLDDHEKLYRAIDADRTVATAIPVEELTG